MSSGKLIGLPAVAGGLVVLVVCLFADSFGLGGEPGFGWKQITGSMVGAVVTLVGLMILIKKR